MDIELVRAAITKKGFKHKWLAGQIGVHPTTLSKYLTGKSPLTRPALILLAQKLELESLVAS